MGPASHSPSLPPAWPPPITEHMPPQTHLRAFSFSRASAQATGPLALTVLTFYHSGLFRYLALLTTPWKQPVLPHPGILYPLPCYSFCTVVVMMCGYIICSCVHVFILCLTCRSTALWDMDFLGLVRCRRPRTSVSAVWGLRVSLPPGDLLRILFVNHIIKYIRLQRKPSILKYNRSGCQNITNV